MEIRIHRPGMLTTVQDLGRPGRRAEGVSPGGAADPFAMRVANLLVGNPEDAAGLEVTLVGPELEFSEPGWIACCGARFDGVAGWRPRRVEAGERLRFGTRTEGCRAYLALAGGLEVERVLGGCGTHLGGGFGGHGGRALREGDVLRTRPLAWHLSERWMMDERVLPPYSREPTVRAVDGSHASQFGDALHAGAFRVSAQSDRMGIRLDDRVLTRSESTEILSGAVAPGTVQVPADGRPIVLMADAQTLGGYPRVAHVASVDLPLLAQLAPGDTVRFARVSLAEAHALLRAQEHRLALLRQGLESKVTR